jgi:hypothetical protein
VEIVSVKANGTREHPQWRRRYLDRFYRSNAQWVEGTREFHELCASVIPVGSRILEVGAGPSRTFTLWTSTTT